MDISHGQQSHFKALCSLLELSLNGQLFSIAGFSIVVGAQNIEVGLANANNQRLLIRRKLGSGALAQGLATFKAIP